MKRSNDGKLLMRYLKKRRKKQKKKDKDKVGNKRKGPADKFDSLHYADRAAEVIRRKANRQSFFIYLSLFTKSYPDRRNTRSLQVDRERKIRALDMAVYKVVQTLHDEGVYDNTVILFASDNGGRYIRGQEGSRESNPNYPLKGCKGTIYEGGTKVPGFIHSPLLLRDRYRLDMALKHFAAYHIIFYSKRNLANLIVVLFNDVADKRQYYRTDLCLLIDTVSRFELSEIQL